MSRLGVVLFGASKYDSHRELNNSRFARSAAEFGKTTADIKIIPGVRTGLLDLYDKTLSVNETLDSIMDFVGKDHDDIIIYYCGHGDVGLREGDYKVLLRTSNRERRYTLLDMAQLVHDVARLALKKRIYFVLDACYSGSAVDDGETMDAGGADAIIKRRLSEAVADGGNGTAAIAASGRLGVALAKREDRLTLFTGAMVRCLREGLVHRREIAQFSWLDLKDEIVRMTRDRLGPDAPIPQLRSFGESPTDITRVPFFANAAFVPGPDGTTQWLPPADDPLRELLYWRTISEQTPPEVFEDFLSKFPKGTYAAPARVLLLQRVEKFNAQQIKAYLSRHPDTAVKATLEARLVALGRDRIRDCVDLAGLELIAAEVGQGELAEEVQRRFEVLRAEQAEREAWDRIKESPDQAAFRDFLERYPVGPFSERAAARLAELLIVARSASPWRDRLGAVVTTVRTALQGRTARYVAAAGLMLVASAGVLTWIGSTAPPTSDSIRRDFDAAGTNVVRLRTFIAQCLAVHCSLEHEARYKLAGAEIEEQDQHARDAAERSQLDLAGADLEALRRFVQQCDATACSAAVDARTRLAKAEAAERAGRLDIDRKGLDTARSDLDALRRFVQQCDANSCSVAQEAHRRLASAEAADNARQARLDADRKVLEAAGSDLNALRRLVQQCDASSCSVAQEAHTRLASAEAVDNARQAQLDADRRILDVAGTDLGALRRVVQQCDLASCSVAQEAHRRLASAEAAAAAANQRFNSYVNYDIHGGDFLDQNGRPQLIATDQASCLSTCRTTTGCVAISYDKWNNACYLKKSLSELTLDPHSDTSIRVDQGQPGVSAAGRHFCSYSGSLLVGDEIQRSASQSFGDCERLCQADDGCVAYSFSRSARVCSALRSVSNRQSHVSDAVSAVRTQYPCR
jgi:hypothetical protein